MTNPELLAELRAYQESLALLPYDLSAQVPRTDLEATLIQTVSDRAKLSETPAISPPGRLPWSLIGLGLGAAIATGTMLLLSLDNQRLRQQLAQTQGLEQELQATRSQLRQLQKQQETVQPLLTTLQQPNTLIYSLQGTGQAASASASLVAVPGHRQMVLVAHNLPQLPKNKVYRVWAARDQSTNLMYCGQFISTPTGTAEWQAPDEACSQKPRKLLVTVDAVTDSTNSGGALVMQSRQV